MIALPDQPQTPPTEHTFGRLSLTGATPERAEQREGESMGALVAALAECETLARHLTSEAETIAHDMRGALDTLRQLHNRCTEPPP